jgi:4-hydroxy-4-methyl-2-oxoglutarate aldolase
VKPVIAHNVKRVGPETIKGLGTFGVATIHEAQGRAGLMRPYMRPLFPAARLAGTAITVLCHAGDNLMIHAALDVCQPGDVLVVGVKSETTDGMFGELLAISCMARGVSGLVIDAGVRDTDAIAGMGFPVWSRSISAAGTVKATAGSVNIPIVCAGTAVDPGDVVVGDHDGVVVVSRSIAEDVARLAAEREVREEQMRARLRAGELSIDIQGLRAKLKAMGVDWVDRCDNAS